MKTPQVNGGFSVSLERLQEHGSLAAVTQCAALARKAATDAERALWLTELDELLEEAPELDADRWRAVARI